ncbi:MAG: SDR family oxidoreductase [Gammaproteobacteria bacterium]|nr:SDR family oxidoreductase [Gammaproteobacteria bacterium]
MSRFNLSDIPRVNMQLPGLNNRTVLISGAERGLGQGIAAYLGQQGMNLVIAGISEEEGILTQKEFVNAGINTVWVKADLSVETEADRAIQTALESYGSIDLLVNNAATNRLLQFTDYEAQVWKGVFEHNLRVVYYLSQGCARHMSVKGGSIVNISSVGGARAHRNSVAYNAAKGAVDSMTRAMALDLAPRGIRVNAVAPGAVINRPISERAKPHREKQAEGIPMGRVGTISDIAAMVGFLASDAASYITGQVFYVDGGLSTQLTPPGIYI